MTDLALLLPPLAAGLLALFSHVPLGRQVLRRGIVFIDLAIAQVASLGVLAGQYLAHRLYHLHDDALHGAHHHAAHAHDAPGWLLALSAAAAALVGAAIVAALARAWPRQQEALIGLLYVGAASLAVVALSADPHGAHRLAALLSGDVLWVTWADLLPLAGATALFLALLRWRPGLLAHSAVFYGSFALLVSLSLPLLGLYLVFATLIVPAVVAQWQPRHPVRHALAVGALGYAGGLLLSWYLDWPSGPAIVLLLIALGLAWMVRSRSRARRPADNGP
ncbi:MAG: metal ABC transporter permease [Pseudomonadota bacterium]|nr:metal ABC transporter permease [Pseudomonadota bacterium]